MEHQYSIIYLLYMNNLDYDAFCKFWFLSGVFAENGRGRLTGA